MCRIIWTKESTQLVIFESHVKNKRYLKQKIELISIKRVRSHENRR